MTISDTLIIGFYILLIGASAMLIVIAFKYYRSWLKSIVGPFLQVLFLITLSTFILLTITIIGIIVNGYLFIFLHIVQLIIIGSIISLSILMMIMMNKWSKRISTINKENSMPSLILYLSLIGQAFKGEAGYMAAYYLGRGLADYVQRSQRSIKSIINSFSMLTGIMQVAPEDLRNETVVIVDSKYITDKIIADLITHFVKGYWEGIVTKIRNRETKCSVRQIFTNNHFEVYVKPLRSNDKIENIAY